MTEPNKFEDLNDRFMSLGTGMTQSNKFRDRWCTLLLKNNGKYVSLSTVYHILAWVLEKESREHGSQWRHRFGVSPVTHGAAQVVHEH